MTLIDISIVMAFSAGLVSFLSPCVLPLIPGYVSFISGVSLGEMQAGTEEAAFLGRKHRRVIVNSLFFILGFSAVFILLGASATWIGTVLSTRLGLFTKLAGVVVIVFGLIKLGLVRPLWVLKQAGIEVKNRRGGLLGAILLGAAFAFGWTPCVGPILGGILTFAGTFDQVSQGIWLLIAYSLGLGVPFLLTALGVAQFFKFFNRIKRHMGLIEKATGLVLVGMGILIFTDSLARLQAFVPFLNRFAL